MTLPPSRPHGQIAALLPQESLSVAHWTGAIKIKDLERVVVHTTVQEKAIAHPTVARLTHRAIVNWLSWLSARASSYARSYLRLAKRAAGGALHARSPVSNAPGGS
jgi:IS5 family transposase